MTAGDTPDLEQPTSLGLLVLRSLGIAALVIGASAALFFGLGRGESPVVVADGPEGNGETIDDDASPDEEPDAAPDEDDGTATDEDGSEPDTDELDEAAEEEDADAGDDPEDGPDEDADEPADDEESEEPDEPEADRIDPSTVSVQVLDGYQSDGGSAADAVAAELDDAGYRIIARNPALLYDVTTVLWTAGSQEAGEQVARDLGAAEVREQPGNLSTSVDVHVVVGADRG